MSTSATMDPTRAALPGGAISVSTLWAQRALRAAGDETLALDGRAGPDTLSALEIFRAMNVPSDTIRPSGEARSPIDRAPTRVIIGVPTERALALKLARTPVAAPSIPGTSGGSRQTIGPSLDPAAPLTNTGGSSWVPWAIGGAIAAAVVAGGAYYMLRGRRGRAPKNRKVPYRGRRRR